MTKGITRTSNGFFEVYDPKEDIYHEYGNKQAAQKALSAFQNQ